MTTRTTGALCAVIVGCAGLTAFAASGFGDDPAPDAAVPGHYRVVPAAVQPAGGGTSAGSAARKPPKHGSRRKHKAPKVTNLITTNPVAVPAGSEIVAQLTCPASKGIPLSGGAISPPAPALVAISVISRFNPNPPYAAEPRNYYVGVRNTGPTDQQFRGTLVCAKGINQ